MKPIAVVALGGNALLKRGEKASIESQMNNSKKAAKHILPLIKKYSIVLTHGNGPQVGNIVIRVEQALGRAYKLPLEVCVAESEGEIGYILEQSLFNAMHASKLNFSVATLLTQVLVDKKDPAFKKPTKPIGPFYTKAHTLKFKKKRIPFIFDAGRGYRRVVPSPKPVKIIEADVIKRILKNKTIVIAAGGGGIPVVKEKGNLKGVEAVIDKDFASVCLAKSIKAQYMFILMGLDSVYLNFGTKKQKRISKMNVKEAQKFYKQGHFPEGSMGPKVLAAIDFLKSGGKKVIITSPEKLQKALIGKAGTTIVKR